MAALWKLPWLAGNGGQGALAEANAALRRMDQLAELLGTIAFGWCITHHSHLIVLPLISAVALVGLPLEVWAIHQVYVLSVCQALHSILPPESSYM